LRRDQLIMGYFDNELLNKYKKFIDVFFYF
jgi:hypothetical protein